MAIASLVRTAFAATFVLLATAFAATAQSPSLTEVLNSSPSSANAVLYADFPALLSVTGDQLYNTETLKMLKEVRLAGELNLATMSPNWEVGYVEVPKLPDVKDVAALRRGHVEEMQGKQVVWTPDAGYLIPSGGDLLGLVRPANRQLLGNWLRKDTGGYSSEFLKSSAAQSTQYISMLVGIDVKNWFSPAFVKQRLETMEFLPKEKLDALSKLFADLEGVSVIVGRRNLDECIITLKFSSAPDALAPYANQLFEDLVNRSGINLPEAKSWKASVDGQKLALRGRIDADNIDMLLDCFSLQRRSVYPSESSSPKPEVDKTAAASLVFFHKTTEIIKKSREYTKRNGAAYSTSYNDRMARRIDELGTLDVDPELVDFAAAVSSSLRGFVGFARSSNVQAGVSSSIVRSTSSGVGESYVPYSYGGHVGGWYGGYGGYYSGYAGYYNPNAPIEAANVINQQSKANSTVAFGNATKEIDEMTAAIRRKMTDKYKVQF